MLEDQKRKKIAYVNSSITDPWSTPVWCNLVDSGKKNNLLIISFIGGTINAPEEDISAKNFIYDLVHKSYLNSAIVWTGSLNWFITKEKMNDFLEKFNGIPAVTLEEAYKNFPCIIQDTKKSLKDTLIHLIKDHGYKKIAFLKGLKGHRISIERYQTYLETLKEFKIPIDENIITEEFESDKMTEQKLKDRMPKILNNKEKIEAIVAMNDQIALAAINILLEKGYRIPEDIAVVGQDDSLIAKTCNTPLTTAKSPHAEMGKKSIEILLKMMDGETVPQRIHLYGMPVIRESCGCEPLSMKKLSSSNKDKKSFPVDRIIEEAGSLSDCLEKEWAHTLRKSFFDEITHQKKNAFFPVLKKYVMKSISQTEDIPLWQNIITELWHQAYSGFLNRKAQLHMLSLIIQKSRLFVSEISLCSQIQNEYKATQLKNAISTISQKISTILDISSLMDVIANELPQIGIDCCYISLFENPDNLKKARLLLAYDIKGRKKLATESIIFDANLLVPPQIQIEDKTKSLLVLPLHYQKEKLGFVIFGVGHLDPNIYEGLRSQLSVALKGIMLFQEKEKLLINLENHARELQEILEKLKLSNKELVQFSYIASHDLQEPLRKISVFAGRMKDKYQTLLDDQGKDYLNRMENATRRMQRLINDLLNYSRLTTTVQPFIPCILSQIVKEVLDDLDIMIEKKKAQIEVSELPVIDADPIQLQQLFQNLITNALKFHKPNQTPVITINHEIKIVSGQKYCEIYVEDNGIGIEKNYYEKIFSIFQSLHGRNEYGGTGIGLAICKKVVERHNGSIRVESILGEGSKFIITLPVNQRGENT